jgi:uroporphyrin-III C-methyltransferase / precorrin-2 dehydrogenase / sirohydrochlorin ferrochelatase
VARRPFQTADLEDAWLVVAAATPDVNRLVAEVAERLRLFVNAVDDPPNATAFLSGVVRRDGVTIAVSTGGAAPALTALLREGLDALLPRDLGGWMYQARASRVRWKREGTPMPERKPLLLRALNALYSEKTAKHAENAGKHRSTSSAPFPVLSSDRGERVPWLNGPEDSWL